MSKAHPDYQQLQTELDDILLSMQQNDLDVDVAVKHYQRGLELIKQLEKQLANAENTITELKSSLDTKQ